MAAKSKKPQSYVDVVDSTSHPREPWNRLDVNSVMVG